MGAASKNKSKTPWALCRHAGIDAALGVHPPSEIKSNFKFKTLRWRPRRWRLTLSENSDRIVFGSRLLPRIQVASNAQSTFNQLSAMPCEHPDQQQESLRPFAPEVSWGVSPKVSPKTGVCEGVFPGMSPGPDTPVFRDPLGETPRDTSGPKGPRDSCSSSGCSQVIISEKTYWEHFAKRRLLVNPYGPELQTEFCYFLGENDLNSEKRPLPTAMFPILLPLLPLATKLLPN